MTDMGDHRRMERWAGDPADITYAVAGRSARLPPGAQHIVTPSGEVMVVLPLAQFQLLSTVAGWRPIATASGQDAAEPAEVNRAIAMGEGPVAAWRKYRGLTQIALAELAGVSRFTVMRIETAGAGSGNRNSRRRITSALDIPLERI